MKVKSVIVIKKKNAVSVFDATSPKYHNYVLANGAVVHNTAKRARDPRYQAVYPIRGKPLNTMEAAQAKVNANAEMINLLAALGVRLDAKDPDKAPIRYGKIIKLTDPDVDGKHIEALLTGNLWKYAPHLIRRGLFYAMLPPLFKCRYKDKLYFGMTKDDIYTQTGTQKCDVQYIKGWGEVNASEMYIAMDPRHRRLVRLMPPTKKGAAELVELLGKKPAYRKKLLGVE